MSLRYLSFNYPNCSVRKHQGKKPPSLLKLRSSSVTIERDEGCKGRSFSNLMSDQDNCIGIIGGASVDTCLNFTKKLSNFSQPFILCSDPLLSKHLSSLEKSYFPFVSGKVDRTGINTSLIVENLRSKSAFLEKSGVCCIAMPCHISHSWYDEIKEGCSVPILHVGECVAKELKEAKLRPIEAGSPPRIGVLATTEELVAKFYQEKLENEGFEVILPDKATMEHTVIPAVEALNRKDFEGAKNLSSIALRVLLVRAVNRVILASDKLQELLPPDDPLWTKCIDPMDALVRWTVKYAHSQVAQ